jgi:hypothetical protein
MTLYLILAAIGGAAAGAGALAMAARKSDKVLQALGGGGPRPQLPK